MRPDIGGEENDQLWVKVLNIDRCVDAPGPTPPVRRGRRDRGGAPAQPATRPGGLGGGWTPDPPKDVSTVDTFFECPVQFIVGYWQTPQEAIDARNAEFDRQYTAATIARARGGDPSEAGGVDPGEVARAETDARGDDNAPLEPPSVEGGGYENPSRYDRELRGGDELVCPLIEDPNYNICDINIC